MSFNEGTIFNWGSFLSHIQWRNRRGCRWAECPQRLQTGKFLLTYREKEARKKGKRSENWEETKENCKMEGGKLEMEVGKEVRTFLDPFLFLFPFFFCLSLFKTTEICFGSTKMGIFYREKSISRRGKNQEKWLCLLRKICLLRPWSYWLKLVGEYADQTFIGFLSDFIWSFQFETIAHCL